MRKPAFSAVLAATLLCFRLCSAEWHLLPGGRVDIGPLKYQQWFYNWYTYQLPDLETSECASPLRDYFAQNSTNEWQCTVVLNCVLGVIEPAATQMLATAMVILGFTPGLLALLSPTIGEFAMVTYERPVLSFLLAFGAPSTRSQNILDYENPFKAIAEPRDESESILLTLANVLPKTSRRGIILILEYVLAAAAVGNIIHVSIVLGFQSVSSWDCDGSYWPLTWVLMPAFLHLLGCFSFWLIPKSRPERDYSFEAAHQGIQAGSLLEAGAGPQQKPPPDAKALGLHIPDPREFVIETQKPSLLSLAFQYFGAGCSIGHIMYGTFVFSSLQFLMVSDAVPVIMRYALSAVVCRFINHYELQEMSRKYRVVLVERVDRKNKTYP